jgi:hypothetical protein
MKRHPIIELGEIGGAKVETDEITAIAIGIALEIIVIGRDVGEHIGADRLNLGFHIGIQQGSDCSIKDVALQNILS